MKKMIMLVIAGLMLICTSNAHAQLGLAGMQKQIKLGLNFANVGGDNVSGTDSKTGMIGSFGLKFSLAGIVAVQPEIAYSKKGFKHDEQGETQETTLDYIEIPVLVKLSVPGTPNLYVGPAMGFNISAETEGEDVSDSIKSNEFSFVIGSDYGLPLPGIGSVIVDLRYTYGLTSVDDSDLELDYKNRVFSLMVGFGF